MSNIDELIEQLRKSADFEDYPIVASFAAIIEKKYLREAADALEKLQAELEQMKVERDAAVALVHEWEEYGRYLSPMGFTVPPNWKEDLQE